jgi:hypothetical protein
MRVVQNPKIEAPKSRRKTRIKVHVILSDVNDRPRQQSTSAKDTWHIQIVTSVKIKLAFQAHVYHRFE